MNEIPCTHPATLQGADGAMRCLTCGAIIKPEKPVKKPAKEEKTDKTDKTDEHAAE